MLEILICAVAFIAMIAETGYFMFGDINNFEWLANIFNLNISDLLAYKVTIVIFFVLADIIAFLLIWNAQSQAVFLKSVKLTLVESVPRNKSAHAYGVFALSIGGAGDHGTDDRNDQEGDKQEGGLPDIAPHPFLLGKLMGD